MMDSNLKSVKIGDQVWMTENLNVTNFRNGEQIPKAKTAEEWFEFGKDGKPAWCNLIWSDGENDDDRKFGKFYNWYAVIDPRGLAPKGWHVPSDSEWKKLTDFLGGEDIAVKKMKSTTGWEKYGSEYNGTNECGFSALPRGGRDSHGVYISINEESYWWSSTESKQMNAPAYCRVNPWTRKIIFSHPVLYRKCSENKGYGLSVRCIRDA
jgi:uncharacterized protein (TIGR02145 family)